MSDPLQGVAQGMLIAGGAALALGLLWQAVCRKECFQLDHAEPSDESEPYLWPDPVTLKAGDEDHRTWIADPEIDDSWPRARPFQEDGHLAAEEHWRTHPDD